MALRPESIGDVPKDLGNYHRDFLRKLKQNADVLTGRIKDSTDTSDPPGTKAVTHSELSDSEIVSDVVQNESDMITWILALS
jgi:hypothetical protein